MTLKEKFRDKILSFLSDNMKEQNATECVKIADEFAIGFGKWLVSNCYSEDDMYWWLINTYGDVRKSTKELLEIYKKEKGL